MDRNLEKVSESRNSDEIASEVGDYGIVNVRHNKYSIVI